MHFGFCCDSFPHHFLFLPLHPHVIQSIYLVGWRCRDVWGGRWDHCEGPWVCLGLSSPTSGGVTESSSRTRAFRVCEHSLGGNRGPLPGPSKWQHPPCIRKPHPFPQAWGSWELDSWLLPSGQSSRVRREGRVLPSSPSLHTTPSSVHRGGPYLSLSCLGTGSCRAPHVPGEASLHHHCSRDVLVPRAKIRPRWTRESSPGSSALTLPHHWVPLPLSWWPAGSSGRLGCTQKCPAVSKSCVSGLCTPLRRPCERAPLSPARRPGPSSWPWDQAAASATRLCVGRGTWDKSTPYAIAKRRYGKLHGICFLAFCSEAGLLSSPGRAL